MWWLSLDMGASIRAFVVIKQSFVAAWRRHCGHFGGYQKRDTVAGDMVAYLLLGTWWPGT